MERRRTGLGHVALLGPTASGKSELALALARLRTEAELVSVDSMSVYRHMDIGTAKPPQNVRGEVPYHLLDLVEPHEEFTVRQFCDAAREALAGIESRAHRALLVAGTGLYLRAVVDDLDFPGRWPHLARALEQFASLPGGTCRLHRWLDTLDPDAARRILPNNKRRLVRALEVVMGSGRRFSSFGPGLGCYPATRFVLVGVKFDPEVHDRCIEERFASMLEGGLLDEVRSLSAREKGMSRSARQALGYRELLAHVEDGVPMDVAVRESLRRTKAFARRQWAWFRRDPRVTWLDPRGDPLGQLLEVWDTAPDAAVGD